MSVQTDPTLKMPFVIIHRAGLVGIPFVFPLAPEEASHDFPSRVAVHQTIEGNFLDDFSGPNAVLARVTLRGTFGYQSRVGGVGPPLPGSLHLRSLEALYETFNALDRSLKTKIGAVQEYVNLGRLYLWRIVIDRFAHRINSQRPLLFSYELVFRRLEDYLSPVGPHLPGPIQAAGSATLGALFG